MPNEMAMPGELTTMPPLSLARNGVEISGPSMLFPEDLEYEDWAAMAPKFESAEMGLGWWRGDWYNWGEDTYEEFAQALNLPDKRKRTVQNCGSVARQYSDSDRERTWRLLSFSHHAVVAYQDPELRSRLLNLAISNEWSVIELRKALQALQERGEEIEAEDDGSGATGNAEFLPIELPITVKSVGALIFDHLTDEDDLVALRAFITKRIGDGGEAAPEPAAAQEEDTEPWNVHSARMILEAIEEAEAYAELPSTYKLAAERLARWIESQDREEGE